MSSPSQPPPSSNGKKISSNAQPPRVTGLVPSNPAMNVANVVNLPPTAEAALLQQVAHLSPDILRDAIEAGKALEEKRLDQQGNELQRQFEYKMALLQRNTKTDTGSRNLVYWFGTIFSFALVAILFFLLYKGEYESAKSLITFLAGLVPGVVSGYFAGRHQSQKKSQESAEEND